MRCAVPIVAIFMSAALGTSSAFSQQEARTNSPAKGTKPLVVLLSDDDSTRGNWIGTYGTYAFFLCGMRSPNSIAGGKGWPMEFSVETGDPKEQPRAWHSSMPTANDKSILLEPNALGRTASAFDDHGEVRALGKGPDLHFRLSIPEIAGPLLVSLYFFEIDWLQYRSYNIKIFADEKPPRLLAETPVAHFFKGKYKRFIVKGPAKLLIVIERKNSPNAQVSALFFDQVGVPDLYLYDRAAGLLREVPPAPNNGADSDKESAEKRARQALAELLRSPRNPLVRRKYISAERAVFTAFKQWQKTDPDSYYTKLEATWEAVAHRIKEADDCAPTVRSKIPLALLAYYAARARCDFKSARSQSAKLASLLLDSSLRSLERNPKEAQVLEDCAVTLMQFGRRDEARPLLKAYVAFCLKRKSAKESREALVSLAKLARRAKLPLPVAEGLEEWQKEHGDLPPEDRITLANLYYIADKNRKAIEIYRKASPYVKKAKRRTWIQIAIITALLRDNRLSEALKEIETFKKNHPGTAELQEVYYRLAEYYFWKNNLIKARNYFVKLRDTAHSKVFKDLCQEYLDRIQHCEYIEKNRSQLN